MVFGLGYRTNDELKRLSATTIAAEIEMVEEAIKTIGGPLEQTKIDEEVNHQRASLHKEAPQPLRKQINEIKKKQSRKRVRLGLLLFSLPPIPWNKLYFFPFPGYPPIHFRDFQFFTKVY